MWFAIIVLIIRRVNHFIKKCQKCEQEVSTFATKMPTAILMLKSEVNICVI